VSKVLETMNEENENAMPSCSVNYVIKHLIVVNSLMYQYSKETHLSQIP
jgi:hypothetical protein